jgi:hypothetical protein
VSIKTVLGWVALAFVVWWVIETPANAAHLIQNIGTFLSNGVRLLDDFFRSL